MARKTKKKTPTLEAEAHGSAAEAAGDTNPLVKIITIQLPVYVNPKRTYAVRRPQATLNCEEAKAFAAVIDGCALEQVELANGRTINNPAEALRYIIEKVKEQL
jgi:hypothetical protein